MQHLVICLMQQCMLLSHIFLMLFPYYLPMPPCKALLVLLIPLFFFSSFLCISLSSSSNWPKELLCFSTVILNCKSSLTLTSHFLSFRVTYWVFSHNIRKQVLQFPSLFTQHSHDFIFLDQGFCGFFPQLFFFQLQLCP